LVRLAQGIVDTTRDTDLDKDQKVAEARKNAERALVTVDTDIPTAGYPPEQLNAFKNSVRSDAYFVLGMLSFKANSWADAEVNLRKSVEAFPQQPDAFTILELAISLDMQNKLPEAMKYVDQVVELTKDRADAGVGKAARDEKSRLVQLSSGAAPGQTPAPKK
jgi:tetratricopeptide (TPR) repeat protein